MNHNRELVNGSRLMFLIDRLDRIQYARNIVELDTAMHEFTHELLHVKKLRSPLRSVTMVGHQHQPISGSVCVQCEETILVSTWQLYYVHILSVFHGTDFEDIL